MENKKDENDAPFEEEVENYGARMDFADAIKTRIERNKIEYNITHNGDNAMRIVNSCDGAAYPVIKHCDRTILTQSLCLLTLTSVIDHSRNLSSLSNLLSTMSTNGEENTKTLDNALQHHFHTKKNKAVIAELLGRDDDSKLDWLESHDVKFAFSMHN